MNKAILLDLDHTLIQPLEGRIFPLAMPPRSGIKHSTSVIEFSLIHFSNLSIILINC